MCLFPEQKQLFHFVVHALEDFGISKRLRDGYPWVTGKHWGTIRINYYVDMILNYYSTIVIESIALYTRMKYSSTLVIREYLLVICIRIIMRIVLYILY